MFPRTRYHRILFGMLIVLALVLGGCGQPTQTVVPAQAPQAAVPAPAQPQAPAPVQAQPVAPKPVLDLKVAFDKFHSTLPDGFYGVKPDALKEQMAAAKPFILDVREPKELADAGFIEGAVNIPIRSLMKNLDKLPAKDMPIVVYCGIGHRGAIALEALRMLGYTNVKSLSGGFTAWKDGNFPIMKDTPGAPVAGAKPEVDAELLAAIDKYLSALPEGFSLVAPTALKEQLAVAKPFLLDVREAKEVTDNGMIEGSVNVPIRALLKSLDKLPQDKSTPIVVYCAVGHRGGMAMMTLQMMGYTNVKSITGGLNNWVKAGFPVVKPS